MVETIYAPIISTEMTLNEALRQASKISRGHNKMCMGFREVTKAIMRGEAHFVILADDMPNNLKTVIIGLAKQFNIPVIKIETSNELGKIVGFTKNRDNETVKSSKCGSAAILDYVYQSEGSVFIDNALRDKVSSN